MSRAGRSLHAMVRKWLGAAPAHPLSVVNKGRMLDSGCPFVCVQADRINDVLSIVFFRHQDGGWYVFPPVTFR